MTDQNGNPWKSERYFSNYEEALTLKNSLKAMDRAGLMEIKIKRCGINGNQYVVKSRQNLKAMEELKQIEEKLTPSKNKKAKV